MHSLSIGNREGACLVADVLLSVLRKLPGRIPLDGLVMAPLLMRVSCSFSNNCTSCASKGNGVKDDRAWTDRPCIKNTVIVNLGVRLMIDHLKYPQIEYSQLTPDGNLALLMFRKRTKDPTSMIFSLWINCQSSSSHQFQTSN